MKNKTAVIILISGLIMIGLSFLVPFLSGIITETVTLAIRWGMFAAGLTCLIISIALFIIHSKKHERKKLLPAGASYEKRKHFLSAPEEELLALLEQLLKGSSYRVFPQASLASVIEKSSGGGFYSELFRIADYVVVDARSTEPLVLIELNDASHKKDDRRLRDEKVEAICYDAGIPVLNIDFERRNDVDYIRHQLKKYL